MNAGIAGLNEANAFGMILLSRSLVSLIAALPYDNQRAALGQLLSGVNELPEANIDPDVVLILAQAFELVAKLVAEQHSSDEQATELQPLIDQVEGLLTGAEGARAIGIARLITPLVEKLPSSSASAILEQLLRVAGIEAASPDAARSSLEALAEVSGKISPPGANQAEGLRIGLQGRLLALLIAEGRGRDLVDPMGKLQTAIAHVGRKGLDERPLLAESYQHFAHEGLARGLAALAPSLAEDPRESALKAAKAALAATGSAEEAAAWATAIKNLLAHQEDTVAVEEVVEILKYPTAALTAREPNAVEPRNATDSLVETLEDRLKLKHVEPLFPGDLRQILDLVKERFPDVDLMKRPERPGFAVATTVAKMRSGVGGRLVDPGSTSSAR